MTKICKIDFKWIDEPLHSSLTTSLLGMRFSVYHNGELNDGDVWWNPEVIDLFDCDMDDYGCGGPSREQAKINMEEWILSELKCVSEIQNYPTGNPIPL